MFKTLQSLHKDRLSKAWSQAAWEASAEARRKAKEEEKATPVKRKLSEREAFQYYVKIKEGSWGRGVDARVLNSKVGRCEGTAKAYRERAGKMPKGKAREGLLSAAGKLLGQAKIYASQRDSLLGRPAYKMVKQELSEEDIIRMIDEGQFDSYILQEIEADTGLNLSDYGSLTQGE